MEDEAAFSEPEDLSDSGDEDLEARSADSLYDASPEEVAEHAQVLLSTDFEPGADKEDLFSSALFNRPPLGTEIDKGEQTQLAKNAI